MQKEKPCSVWNEKSVIDEGEPQKVVREEEGELSIEKTENILENAKNYLLADIKKTNLRIEEINMLYFVLQNFKNRKIFRNDNSSEDDRESKNEKEKESAKKSNLSVSEPEIELNLCKTEDDMNSKGIFKLTVKKSDFSKVRQTSPNDNYHKKVMKWNSSWTSDIMQKRAKKEDCSSSSHKIKNKEDNKEFELADNVKHDKKYFLVHSGRNHCKLCSFKGKLIVHHYKTSHPESEVFVSRINPDITEILIEDALQNREEYNENHPKLQKMTCNFKCPFCLIIIKGTPNMYCNHICSHTGEYYFHCKHCPYWTYNYTNIHSHMKQIHYKIYRAGYKILYPKYIPKVSKFVFGYICSECNFIQLKQTTVEKHVMVHQRTPEIHKVNLGVLLHVDENRTNEIYSNDNHSNPNNLSSQIKEAKVLAPKAKQLVLMSRDYSNCSLVLTDVPMTDIKKQNRKCPNVMVNMTKPALLNTLYNCNLKELVPPYNCEDDGFPICSFKTLYFDEYLKHFKAIHQINRFSSFSSEHELTELVMEGWLVKEVGPFQCRYCKKATVTYKEMGKHQTLFHAQEECSFYYRKFVPNDTVTVPEQVNLEVPSFINHVIHLPDQVHLCDFKLTEGLLSSTSAELIDRNSKALLPQQLPWEPDIDPDQQKMLFDEPEKFSLPANFLNELDPLFLEEEPPKDVGAYNSDVPVIKLKYEALEFQCKWEGCFQKNQSQTALVNHIEDDHIKLQSNYEFSCFWTNCPRRSRPYMRMRQLLTHMRSHTGEKPYKCLFPGCDKAYPQLGNLKTHQRSHKGESLYSCQFPNCFMSFSDNYMRLKHQKAHFKAKTYFCRVTGCGKKYNYSTYFDFWKHMKNHTVDEQLDHKQKKLRQLESVKNNQK